MGAGIAKAFDNHISQDDNNVGRTITLSDGPFGQGLASSLASGFNGMIGLVSHGACVVNTIV